jgi:hypothetical protein
MRNSFDHLVSAREQQRQHTNSEGEERQNPPLAQGKSGAIIVAVKFGEGNGDVEAAD